MGAAQSLTRHPYALFLRDEQDQLSRRLTPETTAFARERIALAQKGLTALRQFDRNRLAAVQRVSADLLDWQLDIIVQEEPWLDYSFPLQQMNGANVDLVQSLTVGYAIPTRRDAENYLAVLAQVSTRIDEEPPRLRLGAKRCCVFIILDATIRTNSRLHRYPPCRSLRDSVA